MKFRKQATTPNIENVVSRSVNFEVTIADLARRSERRAWWVAFGAILMALILAGGYFLMLPLKEKVPYLVMADAYTGRSEEHTSELQSLMRISYAVFCLK